MQKAQHNSQSDVQASIEKFVISELTREGYEFDIHPLEKPNFQLDIYAQYNGTTVIGEIYAGIDKLQPAQKKKVIADCFKLVYVEKYLSEKNPLKEIQKLMVFIDEIICNKFTKNEYRADSWVKDSLNLFYIKMKVIKISDLQKANLREAKKRQQIGMTIPTPKK